MLTLATLYTPEVQELRKFERQRISYCRRHGYRYCPSYAAEAEGRPSSWGKVRLLQRLVASEKWLWWLDADALILRPEFPVLSLVDADYDLIAGKDWNGLNAGVFLLQSNPASVKFLSDVWERLDCIDHMWWEQEAMVRVMDLTPSYRVKWIERTAFNSYPSEVSPNTFVCHFPGMGSRPVERLENMRQVARGKPL